jgi:hypothetical protein
VTLQRADLDWGTSGEVAPGVRLGLPAHIDGVPVGWPPLMTGGRWYRDHAYLPMVEAREDDDQPSAAASWPTPDPNHDLDAKPSGEQT